MTWAYAFQWFAVFCSYVTLDVAWARYTQALARGDAFWAANYAAVLPIMSGFATIQFVDDPWLLVPVALGAYVGTFFGTGKKEDQK